MCGGSPLDSGTRKRDCGVLTWRSNGLGKQEIAACLVTCNVYAPVTFTVEAQSAPTHSSGSNHFFLFFFSWLYSLGSFDEDAATSA